MSSQHHLSFEACTCITDVACAANESLETDSLLPVIASTIVRTLDWDRIVIGLVQADGMLHIVVDHRLNPIDHTTAMNNYVTEHDFSLIVDVLKQRQTCLYTIDSPEVVDTRLNTIMREVGFHTMLTLMLQDDHALYGTLLVGSATQRDVSDDEIMLLQKISTILTATIARIVTFEELQAAGRLRSAFLAKITHDMRTPVTSIIGYTNMMHRQRFGEVPEAFKEPLSYMVHSSNVLLNLVNDVLDFSKMEAGHLIIETSPIDLASIIRNVAGVIRPHVEERRLALIVDVADNLPLVRGNQSRLEQIVTNLVSNAVKFCEHGSVTIRAQELNHRVRLSVQDTGIGIPLEQQALIFGEYEQIRNQHNIQFTGTGLGLAISRGLVEALGGTMTLESEFGNGSTFHCDLRIATAIAHEKERESV